MCTLLFLTLALTYAWYEQRLTAISSLHPSTGQFNNRNIIACCGFIHLWWFSSLLPSLVRTLSQAHCMCGMCWSTHKHKKCAPCRTSHTITPNYYKLPSIHTHTHTQAVCSDSVLGAVMNIARWLPYNFQRKPNKHKKRINKLPIKFA